MPKVERREILDYANYNGARAADTGGDHGGQTAPAHPSRPVPDVPVREHGHHPLSDPGDDPRRAAGARDRHPARARHLQRRPRGHGGARMLPVHRDRRPCSSARGGCASGGRSPGAHLHAVRGGRHRPPHLRSRGRSTRSGSPRSSTSSSASTTGGRSRSAAICRGSSRRPSSATSSARRSTWISETPEPSSVAAALLRPADRCCGWPPGWRRLSGDRKPGNQGGRAPPPRWARLLRWGEREVSPCPRRTQHR